MPFRGFEPACVAIVALALVAMGRRRPWRALALDYAALAIAGYLGEESCVGWYEYYHYAPAWHGRLDRVPVLIPTIWPLVILSARDVATALAPTVRGRWRPVLVGALVVFDASLVEVIAVRAGLWSWVEPGHLGVPLLGILGWGFFAGCADVALSRRGLARAAGLAVALAATHGLILAAWWGLFRWTARGALGDGSFAGLAALSALALAGGVIALRRGRSLPLDVALPRMIAAALFLAVLVRVAPRDGRLWLHAALVAVPYLAVTRWSRPGLVPPTDALAEKDVGGQSRA